MRGRVARTLVLGVLFLASSTRPLWASSPVEPGIRPPSPEEAIQRLEAGNQRYVRRRPRHPHQGVRTRMDLSHGQHPFAVLVSCSDSRVAPTVVFDQGLGDLFEIRTAGHVLDGAALGSIEYAVEHLHTPLIVIMGHDRCGAVTAAIHSGSPRGHLRSIVEAIRPSVARVRHDKVPVDLSWRSPTPEHLPRTLAQANFLTRTIVANVEGAVRRLHDSSEVVREALEQGHTRVVGAFYDLDTGGVDLAW